MKKNIKASEAPKTKKPIEGVGTRKIVENPKGATTNNTSKDIKTENN